MCDSRDAWLYWRLTGLGGAGVVCVNQQQYLFVLGKKSAELPFVSPIDRLSIMVASTKVSQSGNEPVISLTVQWPHTGMTVFLSAARVSIKCTG